MIFGSISYLNLLPFQIYFKRYIKSSQIKQIVNFKKSYPSLINKNFEAKKIDAAFISSIKSKNKRCTNLGIVANGPVYSVFLIPNKKHKNDIESDTSNALAKVLNLNGKIIIGDKALKEYLNKQKELIDLSLKWKEKTNLPFVFARLCFNKKDKTIKKLAKKFKKRSNRVPYYYLTKAANKKGLSSKELKWYLNHIYYNLGWREKKSLKLFLKLYYLHSTR